MDYTEIYRCIKKMLYAQGIDESFLERHETLYYDESGNIKHLIVKGQSLNADIDSVFVLGGIQAEDSISTTEMKSLLGKSVDSELKAKDDLKGGFADILRKNNFKQILELILNRNWHIHFNAVQVLYYAFVDIVDSIDRFNDNPMLFKSLLYEVLKTDPIRTINHFKQYKYPNVKNRDKENFISGIVDIVEQYISKLPTNTPIRIPLQILRKRIDDAKSQDELPFIQDEETHIWVKQFTQFYRQEIMQFYKKTLIFDEEKQVHKELDQEEFKIEGNTIKNYSFVDSSSNAMIQISDYVVSIIRKYVVFLDRQPEEVECDINNFDENQKSNFILLNKVLKRSNDFNPAFIKFISSGYTYNLYMKSMNAYGL